jgi:hypothetical protein
MENEMSAMAAWRQHQRLMAAKRKPAENSSSKASDINMAGNNEKSLTRVMAKYGS